MTNKKVLKEGDKISAASKAFKTCMKEIRIREMKSMNAGAAMLGTSRKQLEDLETHRNYGCHISLDDMVTFCEAYDVQFSIECYTDRTQITLHFQNEDFKQSWTRGNSARGH